MQLCQAGRFSATVDGNCDGTCEAGYYCAPGARSARDAPCPRSGDVFCPPGSERPRPVAAGFYALYDGALPVDEAACPRGSYCAAGKRLPCPAGTYGNVSALSTSGCSAACGGAGEYCPEGSLVPLKCPPGKFCTGGSAPAAPCPPGTFGQTAALGDARAAGPVRPGRIVPLALCYRRLARREPMENHHGSRTLHARRLVPRATIVPRTALRPCRAKARWRPRKASPGGRSARLAWEPRKRHEQATTLRAAWKGPGRGKRRASRATAATSACGTRARQGHTNLRRAWRRPRSTRRSAGPALPVTTVRGRRAPRNRAPRERTATSLATRLDSPTPRARARASAATTARKAPCCRLRVRLERLATRRVSRRPRARRRASRTRPVNVLLRNARRGTTAPPARRTGGNASAARACTAPRGSGAPVQPDEGMVGVAGGGEIPFERAGQADCEDFCLAPDGVPACPAPRRASARPVCARTTH